MRDTLASFPVLRIGGGHDHRPPFGMVWSAADRISSTLPSRRGDRMDTSTFPPADGWCVEVTERDGGQVVAQQVFVLPEDARDFAKQHVWQHKDHVARVFERQLGATIFTTEIAFQR
jgi:hypothetical protein